VKMDTAAFPFTCIVDDHGEPQTFFQPGMTLRDYFAAHALTGILATCVYDMSPGSAGPRSVAASAYAFADAMLAEREKP